MHWAVFTFYIIWTFQNLSAICIALKVTKYKIEKHKHKKST